MVFLSACSLVIGEGKYSSIDEEPSSEPAQESSDSADGDSGDSTGSDGSTDDTVEDTSVEPSSEPSDDTADSDTGYLNPDILLFTFRHGYVNGGVNSLTVDSTGVDLVGSFSLILFDSMNDDYCVVDWTFDETTVAPDPAYSDGYVVDGFMALIWKPGLGI